MRKYPRSFRIFALKFRIYFQMEKLANALFSMRSMAVGMLLFLVAIARATFLESSDGIQSAKLWIYNALWFEILLAFLSVNLIANIFRYQMWKREKIALFTFHISFLVIFLGAWFTRNISFEGRMTIREGEKSNIIYSGEPYLWLNVNDGKQQFTADKTWLKIIRMMFPLISISRIIKHQYQSISYRF